MRVAQIRNKIKENCKKIVKGKKIVKESFIYKHIEQEIITKLDLRLKEYDQVVEHVFRGLGEEERSNSTYFERLHTRHGVLRSTSKMSPQDKFDANQFFQYRDKAEVALCPASIWGGGDYMEFGSTDVNTFRNFLTAYDIFNVDKSHPDVRFYGFDIFGETKTSKKTSEIIEASKGYREYMNLFTHRGDLLQQDIETIKNHDLFVDKVHLIQGYFEDTLTKEFKDNYLKEGRGVGFACLDCNIAPPYKIVFEFLIDLMKPHSYIYMDEYYSNSVIQYFDQFVIELRKRHNMDARLVRNAGGFGALFYLYQINDNLPPLQFKQS
jgi:hypothetical protein